MASESEHATPTSSSRTEDWSAKAADAVESALDIVHDKVVRPAVLAGRAVVFGLVIAVVATMALVLLTIALVRLLDVYAFGGRVWAADALIGVVACAAGLALWNQRTKQDASEHPDA